MLKIVILSLILLSRAEIFSTEQRLSTLYRNKRQYLTQFCACEPLYNETYGFYTFRVKLIKSSQRQAANISLSVYNDNGWNRQKNEKDCQTRLDQAIVKYDVTINMDTSWSELVQGYFPQDKDGIFYFTLNDCQQNLKELQYEVQRYQVEIVSTNGTSSVDYRFKNMYLIHLLFLIILGLICYKWKLYRYENNWRNYYLFCIIVCQLLHHLLEFLNYQQTMYVFHLFSEFFTNLAFLTLHFVLTFIGWGMFLIHDSIPNEELNIAVYLLLNCIATVFSLVFSLTQSDPGVFHNLDSYYGVMQMIFRAIVCGLGLIGISKSLNKDWSKMEDKQRMKYVVAKDYVLTNIKFLTFQIIVLFFVQRQSICAQHSYLTWVMSSSFVVVILVLLQGEKTHKAVIINSDILPA